MISKNQIKHVNSLKLLKKRKEYGEFVVEGEKIVDELLQTHFKVKALFAIKEWICNNESLLNRLNITGHEISKKELEHISSLKTPNSVLAVVEIPEENHLEGNDFKDIILVLDHIQDPGNLGTIIRTADWYGIKHVVCSNDTVDLFNSKVIQSTMGSFLRVNMTYMDLMYFFNEIVPKENAIYGAMLDGENLYQKDLTEQSILFIGNESKGISEELKKYITHKIKIPSMDQSEAESLNASIATAIICAEFRRKTFI